MGPPGPAPAGRAGSFGTPTAAGRRNFGTAADPHATPSARPSRPARSLARPRRPGRARLVRDGDRRQPSRARATSRSPRSTSAPRASSGCCCATRRSRSSESTEATTGPDAGVVEDRGRLRSESRSRGLARSWAERVGSLAMLRADVLTTPQADRVEAVGASAAYGSTGSPAPGRNSRCRCGPVVLPVEPTYPRRSPVADLSADGDGELVLVAVPELVPSSSGDDGLVAVGAVVADRGDDAVGDRVDRGAARRGEVEAGVGVGPQAARLAEAGGQAVAGRPAGPTRSSAILAACFSADLASLASSALRCWPAARPRPAAPWWSASSRASRRESRLTAWRRSSAAE